MCDRLISPGGVSSGPRWPAPPALIRPQGCTTASERAAKKPIKIQQAIRSEPLLYRVFRGVSSSAVGGNGEKGKLLHE